jgi:hypothetical protein
LGGDETKGDVLSLGINPKDNGWSELGLAEVGEGKWNQNNITFG